MIGVIGHGLGNPGSVLNMIRRIGGQAALVEQPADVRACSKLILPGVGSFDTGMRNLADMGLDDAIRGALDDGAWLLGICLGMQLLLDRSEEGEAEGLGLIPGRVCRFDVADKGLPVPHMGWNTIDVCRPSPIFGEQDEERRYYFVHSYYVTCDSGEDVIATTDYGGPFASAIQRGKVLGVQFHPEKSHRFGMDLLGRFVAL